MKRIVFCIILFFVIVSISYIILKPISNTNSVDLKINRFEKELFSIKTQNIIQKTEDWDKNFGSFNEVFSSQILRANNLKGEVYYNSLLNFVQNKDMREAYDSTVYLYSDFKDIETGLEFAFSRFLEEFPRYELPEITTFFGGFNYGVITYDNNIAIGLENFLGKNSRFYKYLGDPHYMRFQKQKKFILSNVMEAWFNRCFQHNLTEKDFLSQIIYKGKMMYFLHTMLPRLSPADKFRFSSEQMSWVEDNESAIWEFFIKEDLLFSNNENSFRSFINYAPFAKGMPNEAPGRVAYFIGYRIVEEYLLQNKITLEQLINLTDSRKFLSKSRYKPRK